MKLAASMAHAGMFLSLLQCFEMMMVKEIVPVDSSVIATLKTDPSHLRSLNLAIDRHTVAFAYWKSVVNQRWRIVCFALLIFVLSILVAFSLSPTFESDATIIIEIPRSKLSSSIDLPTSAQQQRDYIQTQLEVLKSRAVTEKIIRKLDLLKDPSLISGERTGGFVSSLLSSIGITSKDLKGIDAEATRISQITAKILANVEIVPVRSSNLAHIFVKSQNPVLAAKLANAFATALNEADRDARAEQSRQVSSLLQDRLAELRSNLTQSERRLQDFRDKSGIVDVNGSAQTQSTQQFGGLMEKLTAARSERISAESTYQAALLATKSGADGVNSIGSVPAVLRDPAVVEAQRSLVATEARLADLRQSLGPNNDKVQKAVAEVTELKALLSKRQALALKALENTFNIARSTESALEAALKSQKLTVRDMNQREFDLSVLEREYQGNKQLYELFLNKAREADFTGEMQTTIARVVDSAEVPSSPIAPKKLQIVLLATVAALLISSAAAIFADRLDDSLRHADDTEDQLGVPVLASIPEIEDPDERRSLAHMYASFPHSNFSEGIRTARTGILLSSLDSTRRIIVVTSSLPSEGKTTIAINLAIAHSQSEPTLIIDCDLRRGQLSRLAGARAGTFGLTEFLSGAQPDTHCVLRSPVSNLVIMPTGMKPPNPLDLFHSKHFHKRIIELSRQFSTIILDTPPVELVSDAIALAPLSTSTVFVVHAHSTSAAVVRRSLAKLQRAKLVVLGVVLNKTRRSSSQVYYDPSSYSASEDFPSSTVSSAAQHTSPTVK